MGAHCCASEAADGARRERAVDAIAEAKIQAETSDSLECSMKPLWLLEHEEMMTAAQSHASAAEPPPSPPDGQTPATWSGSHIAAKRSTGKALVRSLTRQDVHESKAIEASSKVPWRALSQKKLSTVAASATLQGGVLHHVVRIFLQGARGLRSSDIGSGKSDPYCICEIPGKPSSKFKTNVVKDSLDPFWHQVVELSGFANADTLRFSVFDKDTFTADDCLGQAMLNREDAIRSGGFKGELTLKRDLETANSPDAGRLEVSVELVRSYYLNGKVMPQITEVNVKVDDQRELIVNIYSASNLRNADWVPGQGVSDPYCTCEVLGKSKTKIRTQTCKNTLNPTWDFSGTIHGYCRGDPLLFTVMDEDDLKADDFLGRATIEGSSLFDDFQGELKLDKNATIRVKVEVSTPSKTDEDPAAEQGPAALSAALLQAADTGDAKAFKRLLAAGASLEATTAEGLSVLHVCVLRRNEDFVARLLRKKGRRALLLMRAHGRDTALHMAARDDLKGICRMLVREGASTRSKDAAGRTPSELASGELAEWLQSEDPVSIAPPWEK